MNPVIVSARDIRFSTASESEAAAGLDAILVCLTTFIQRFVVVTDHQAVAIALWVIHTHAIAAFDATPYLQVTSATKRAGKTRLLEALEPLVARPWLTGRTSAAALVRKVDAECPTLLLDESDAAFGGQVEYAEALRGLLNSGYRRSGKSTVCVGQGAKMEARDFSTFCPKAIAGIGKLPDTVADRSIAIQLRRKTTDEPCQRWRERDGHAEAAPLRDQLAAWAETAVEILRDARPALPNTIGDRQADCWEPLLAIADLAGGSWPGRARSAAIALAGTVEDQDIAIELLSDIHYIITDDSSSVIATKDLLEQLTVQEDRPWATWSKGKPMTAHRLARLLATFSIYPDLRRTGANVHRSYRVDAFQDAIARYLPLEVLHRYKPNENGAESQIPRRYNPEPCNASKSAKTPIDTGTCNGVTLSEGETGHGDAGDAGDASKPLLADDPSALQSTAPRGRNRWAGRLPAPGEPPDGLSPAAWARRHQRDGGTDGAF